VEPHVIPIDFDIAHMANLFDGGERLAWDALP
jgi:hypothetical protein